MPLPVGGVAVVAGFVACLAVLIQQLPPPQFITNTEICQRAECSPRVCTRIVKNVDVLFFFLHEFQLNKLYAECGMPNVLLIPNIKRSRANRMYGKIPHLHTPSSTWHTYYMRNSIEHRVPFIIIRNIRR